MIDLHQLHRRSVHFNHGNQHASTRTVRRNDHLLIADRLLQVVDLKGNVRNGLHQLWIRRVIPVSLPLNAEWVVLVVAYRHLQMRQWNLAIEICGRRYPDMVVLHYQGLLLRCIAGAASCEVSGRYSWVSSCSFGGIRGCSWLPRRKCQGSPE